MSAENIVINKNTANRFINDLRKVNKDAAEILIMKYIDELSHDEIAAKLGITPATSRKRLSRAIKLMKNNEQIKKYKVRPFIIVLLVTAVILTACAIEPIRRFFIEVYQEFTSFRRENTEVTEVYIPETIEFGYIPEGYSVAEKIFDRTRLFEFSCDEPDKSSFILLYEFDRSTNNNNTNSEGGGVDVISINGHDCFVTTSSKIDETIATIYLSDSMIIEYVGQLDYEEMTKLLESINILK